MIQCYAPTDATEMQEKENFYSQLNAVVDKIPKADIKIYMGDVNAKMGSDNSYYEHVMGRLGLGEMCENGELLAEFCGNNDMVIGGSLFPHRPIRLRIARIQRQEDKIGRRFNTRRLEDAAVRRSFVEELENHAADIPEGGSVEDQWTAIKNAFIATGENNLGELRTQRKQWITDDTWKQIEERRDAKAAIERAKTRGAKAATRQPYSALEKEVKRSCRRDKRLPSRRSGTKINATIPAKDTSGQLLTDRTDQLKRWFEHFENLFQVSATPPTTRHDPPRVRRITRVNTEAPGMARDRSSHPEHEIEQSPRGRSHISRDAQS
ncbi:uncharacterized protein LOC131688237 [Topomyia yanbarensis]|uniref:uncharacterized protein LOC131688237 n=1 Tax=Topomyia yanbarensis TaxID=2498891 RepID=UPI00273CEA64|nr:uncharacterized protein LOC131688237 [Topomyia yanbarensis]